MDPPVPSPLTDSANWNNYLDLNPFDPADTVPDGLSWAEGSPLTPDFDLILFVKGEYSGTEIMDAQLAIEWDDASTVPGEDEPPPAADPDVITVYDAEYKDSRNVLSLRAGSDAGEAANLVAVYGGISYTLTYSAYRDIFYGNFPTTTYYPTVDIVSELGGSITVDVELD
ncbi:MAG: hypothetical protein ACYC9M_10920 [Desulfobulbaceae bacterium]